MVSLLMRLIMDNKIRTAVLTHLTTRVYYGELYTDDARYMAKKSPYYDAITTLLTNRMKYVSGDQSMKVDSLVARKSCIQCVTVKTLCLLIRLGVLKLSNIQVC